MSGSSIEAVVIGASAGALEALSIVLPALPSDFRLPIMVVVHLPPDKKSVMAELLRAKCRIGVKEAEDKEPMVGGTAYFAPPDYHLLVEGTGRLSLSSEEQVLYSRPSIDVLFETAADAIGPGLLGVLLTGANSDGAKGLRAIEKAGGSVVVQRPDTAMASAMPIAGHAACAAARVMTLDEIARHLQEVAAVA